ncbi:MAG: tetratricopeptide repeat protein [Candidatus Anammoximicrobium sp.]|nr:tetratricopeptide repeat protein [Candidatus Anammoximicrobium sp.]
MNNRKPLARVLWLCFLLFAAGCSSPLPWERDWGRSGSTSLSGFFNPDRASLAGNPSHSATMHPSAAAAPSGAAAASPLSAATQSVTKATQSVTKAFKSAGEKVSSALDVKPKVIPASDPAKLSSAPARLTPALYVQAAQLSENQGAVEHARQQYEKALQLDPRDVNALIAFARFQDRQGNGDQALQLYHRAQGLAPTNTTVLNDLGLFHARRGNLSASLESFQTAVRLEPRNVRYRNNLAAALIESGRVAEGVDALRAVHPEATALFNAACLLSQKNQTQEAAALLEESLRIDPSLVAAQDMLQKLRGPAATIASPDRPPAERHGGQDGPELNTAFRNRIQVWESTARREVSPQLSSSNVLPRKLPSVEP